MNLNILSALVIIALTSSCQAAPEMSMQAKNLRLEISSILDETSLRKESDFAPYMIYSNEKFLEAYKNPCKHIGGAVEIINDESSSLDKYEEIILSNIFYDLPLGEYIDWISRTIAAYDKKLVSLEFLKRVAFPILTQRADIYLAYKSDQVQKLYTILSKYSDFSSRTEKILSGETSSWLVNYFSDNQMELPTITLEGRCAKNRNGDRS